jgi:hypothetical protein
VIVLGQALMPTAPAGPRQALLGSLLHGEDQPPQQPSQLRDAQRGRRPRRALNPARILRAWVGGRLFFNASTAMVPARITTKSA